MIKVYIFNKSNDISRVYNFKKFFQCIDSEISLTHCTEISAVYQNMLNIKASSLYSQYKYDTITMTRHKVSDAVQSVAITSTREGLRSAETINYATPRVCSKFGERAFSHAGPAAWNQLPVTIRNAQIQAHFKKLLKTFLFTQFYSCC